MQEVLHYPRLDTILAVEHTIRAARNPLSKNAIDRLLKKSVMRPTLNLILRYLEESGKIAILKEGIIWIYKRDASGTLKARLRRAVPHEDRRRAMGR
jgi:hypothetical protein